MSALVVAGVPLALVVLELASRWPLVTSAVVIGSLVTRSSPRRCWSQGSSYRCARTSRPPRSAARRAHGPRGLACHLAGPWTGPCAPAWAYISNVIAIVSGYTSAMAIEEPGFGWTYAPALVVSALLLAQAWMSVRDARQASGSPSWRWWAGSSGSAFARVRPTRHPQRVLLRGGGRHVRHVDGDRAPGAGDRTRNPHMCGAGPCARDPRVGFVGLLDRSDSVAAVSRAWTAVTDGEARDAWWGAALPSCNPWDAYGLPVFSSTSGDALDDRGPVGRVGIAGAPWSRGVPCPCSSVCRVHARTRRPQRPIDRGPAAPDPASDATRGIRWPKSVLGVSALPGSRLLSATTRSGDRRWLLLRPAAIDRCGAPHDHVTLEAPPGVPIDVPARPGAITLASVTYQQSIADVLASVVFKGQNRFITYGTGTWRMPYVPHAQDLMLNAPVPDAGFPGMPVTPYPSLGRWTLRPRSSSRSWT